MSFTETLNAYSLFIVFPLFMLSLAFFLPVKRWRLRAPIYVGVVVVAVLAYAFIRPGNSTVASTDEANQVLASGEPVFIEFFSNNCALCLASQPRVMSLESKIDGRAEVMKLNVQDSISLPIMRRFNAFSTPTFVVVNGDQVWKQNGAILDTGQALEALGLS